MRSFVCTCTRPSSESAVESSDLRTSLLTPSNRGMEPDEAAKRDSYSGFLGGYDTGRPGDEVPDLIQFAHAKRDRTVSTDSYTMDPELLERVAPPYSEQLYTVINKPVRHQNSRGEELTEAGGQAKPKGGSPKQKGPPPSRPPPPTKRPSESPPLPIPASGKPTRPPPPAKPPSVNPPTKLPSVNPPAKAPSVNPPTSKPQPPQKVRCLLSHTRTYLPAMEYYMYMYISCVACKRSLLTVRTHKFMHCTRTHIHVHTHTHTQQVQVRVDEEDYAEIDDDLDEEPRDKPLIQIQQMKPLKRTKPPVAKPTRKKFSYDEINIDQRIVLEQLPPRQSAQDNEMWMTVKFQTLPTPRADSISRRSSSSSNLTSSDYYSNLADLSLASGFVGETQRRHSFSSWDDRIVIHGSSNRESIIPLGPGIVEPDYTNVGVGALGLEEEAVYDDPHEDQAVYADPDADKRSRAIVRQPHGSVLPPWGQISEVTRSKPGHQYVNSTVKEGPQVGRANGEEPGDHDYQNDDITDQDYQNQDSEGMFHIYANESDLLAEVSCGLNGFSLPVTSLSSVYELYRVPAAILKSLQQCNTVAVSR